MFKRKRQTQAQRNRAAAKRRRATVGVRRAQRIYRAAPFEKKFIDYSIADGSIAAAMSTVNLVVIPQGDTESERVGRRVTITDIHVKGRILLPAATAITNTSGILKMFILQDKQTNGATFAATDLLETDSIYSFRNLANSKRFKVLAQEVITLKAGGAAPTAAAYGFSEASQWVTMNKECSIPIEYDNTATTGVVATQRTNSVHICFQPDTDELLVSNLTVRVRYLDG